MAACDRDVFDIPVEIDVYRQEFHVTAPIAVYFGNRTSKVDRMYRAEDQRKTKTKFKKKSFSTEF